MKKLLLAAMISAVASPALATPPPWAKGNGPPPWAASWSKPGKAHDAPLPLAAGLPALALVGAAFALAARRKSD